MPVQQNDIPTVQFGDKESDLPTLKMGGPEPEQPANGRRPYGRLEMVLSAVALFLIFVIVWAAYPDLPDLYRYTLKPAIARYWPNALAVITLLVIAYNLYLVRGYRRLWFGIAEIALSAGVGWYAINKAVGGSVPDAIVILLAALYLAGRGFVNLSYRLEHIKIQDQDRP
jgi:hypothetical protein